ncbi:ribonuclease E [Salinisphaera sp. PC39]|uniref:Rne/Rng family ribonuclease n=1 Tax=Salinisphaera sp. PC39 TaxID=1304156 RepID=UPI00333E992E
MKRILINATQPEELRVAIVDGQKLRDLDIEVGSREQRKANVYKGRITRIEPSLEAAFVDYGGGRHGFLPLKEVARPYFKQNPGQGRIEIKEVLSEGQELIVQVEKEERGNKGAALTTFISLAGRYLVLMPNNPRAGGVSRRIDGDDRAELREAMSDLTIPSGMGVIARTAGVGRAAEELQWDLDYLLQLWEKIREAAEQRPAPFLIYQESNVIIRALRDYLRDDIGEVIIDQPDIYRTGHEFMEQVMPGNLPKLKLYEDETPLFSRFQVESQIETAFQREVTLPSGGAIIIDHTEALTTIDINSARSTGGGGIEETALHTNLEAADEIARQLRLRDLGGLLVIDFIDMESNKNQREVEKRLRDAVKEDRARVQLGRISRFGLLEMSRQRLRPSLGEYSTHPCPRCLGQGTIRSVESLALSILRLLEEEAMKTGTARVVAQLPIPVGSFLLNEKRADIADIQRRSEAEITLVPSADLETPHYEIRRIRGDQLGEDDNDAASYRLRPENLPEPEPEAERAAPPPPPKPAVSGVTRSAPAAAATTDKKTARTDDGPGLWQRLWARIKDWFAGDDDTANTGKERQRNERAGGKRAAGRPQQARDKSQGEGKSRGGDSRRSGGGQRRGGGNGGGKSQSERRKPQQRRGDGDDRKDKDKDNKDREKDKESRKDDKPQTDTARQGDAESKRDGGQDQGEDGGRSRSGRSRRGRRGGRRRRGGRNRGGQAAGEAQANDGKGGNNKAGDNKPDENQSGGSRKRDTRPDTETGDRETRGGGKPAGDQSADGPTGKDRDDHRGNGRGAKTGNGRSDNGESGKPATTDGDGGKSGKAPDDGADKRPAAERDKPEATEPTSTASKAGDGNKHPETVTPAAASETRADTDGPGDRHAAAAGNEDTGTQPTTRSRPETRPEPAEKPDAAKAAGGDKPEDDGTPKQVETRQSHDGETLGGQESAAATEGTERRNDATTASGGQ